MWQLERSNFFLIYYQDVEVATPQRSVYSGKRFKGKVRQHFFCSAIIYYTSYDFFSSICSLHIKLCGVSILRAGEVLEPALMSVCKDITIGKILIQTNEATGEPEVCI